MNEMEKIEGKAGRMTAGSGRTILAETFSGSFSKWVRHCSPKQWQSTLNLFRKSPNFEPKIGHEPPDSDLRLWSLTGSCENCGRLPGGLPVISSSFATESKDSRPRRPHAFSRRCASCPS